MSQSQIVNNLSDEQRRILLSDSARVASYGQRLEAWPAVELLSGLCEQMGIPFLSELGIEMVDTTAFDSIRDYAVKWGFLPLYRSGLIIVIATTQPWNEMYLRNLRKSLEKEIRLVGVTEAALDRATALLSATDAVRPVIPTSTIAADIAREAPFESWQVREDDYRELIRRMVERAFLMQASDIVLDPMLDRLSVRFRIHGTLEVMPPIEKKHINSVIMEVKLLAHVPTSDVSHFKSGRASMTLSSGVTIDLRCEVQPTHHGEGVILRLLDPSFMKKFSGALPFSGEQLAIANYCLGRSRGLILVTGPTGSGKTTTLYSALTSLDYRSKNVRTLENPVEYAIDGIVQSSVGNDGDAPATFLDGLRSHMRADPDVILVGEIRDEATAITAMRAALTGHLILSTMHTNDSIDSINRLMDLGVSPYLIKSTLLLVISQRLIARLCPRCRQAIVTPDKVVRHFAYYGQQAPSKVYIKGGCPSCFHTGVSGRLPIFEFFFPSAATRDQIKPNFIEGDLRKAWKESGGKNLVHGALHLVADGTTTYEELEIHETDYVG